MMYLLLLIGFVLLIKGADFFVEGSSSIAGILKEFQCFDRNIQFQQNKGGRFQIVRLEWLLCGKGN